MWNTMWMHFATATGRYKSRKDNCRRDSHGTGQTNHNRRSAEWNNRQGVQNYQRHKKQDCMQEK